MKNSEAVGIALGADGIQYRWSEVGFETLVESCFRDGELEQLLAAVAWIGHLLDRIDERAAGDEDEE